MKGTIRSVAGLIIFSILTCGIYHLYWIYATTNEINQYLGEEDTSGGLVLIFGIITCGIYFIYWYYKMGKKLQSAQSKVLSNNNDESILYLILAVLGFAIIASAIIQSNLNKVWENI